MKKRSHLIEVAGLFLKLGCIGFGGPAVHLTMMEKEVVHKRNWFSHQHFLDLIGATNLIPGPNSTEMAMHCGQERAGWKGLLLAGFCFISPAVLITAIFAWAYQHYGKMPQVEPLLYGAKPAIIAIIVSLMISLGKKALKSFELAIIGLITAALAIYGLNVIYLLFGAGLAGVLLYIIKDKTQSFKRSLLIPMLQINNTVTGISNWKVFWLFLKIGAIIYGSGYVLFAFLNTELVQTGLLTKNELVDAIAVGQFTPGPVFSSATFIGWQIAGPVGALAATVGIFLPSFLFVAFLNPLIPRLRRSKIMSAFLDTVNVASIALIFAVCIDMGKASITDWKTLLIAVICFTATLAFKKLNSAFILLGGAAMGYLLWGV